MGDHFKIYYNIFIPEWLKLCPKNFWNPDDIEVSEIEDFCIAEVIKLTKKTTKPCQQIAMETYLKLGIRKPWNYGLFI